MSDSLSGLQPRGNVQFHPDCISAIAGTGSETPALAAFILMLWSLDKSVPQLIAALFSLLSMLSKNIGRRGEVELLNI